MDFSDRLNRAREIQLRDDERMCGAQIKEPENAEEIRRGIREAFSGLPLRQLLVRFVRLPGDADAFAKVLLVTDYPDDNVWFEQSIHPVVFDGPFPENAYKSFAWQAADQLLETRERVVDVRLAEAMGEGVMEQYEVFV